MQFNISFGLGFDRDGKPIDTVQRQEAIKAILARASCMFGGCTLLTGHGAWINGKGDLVVEESATLVVNDNGNSRRLNDGHAHDLGVFIGKLLNQEAVNIAEVAGVARNVVVEV